MTIIRLALFATLIPAGCLAQATFNKVEIRTTYGQAEQGNDGKLHVDRTSIVFAKNNGTKLVTIPTKAVTELFYSRVAGRRIGAAIIVSPLLLFSKGRKHYLTLSFNDGKTHVGAIEFKLHKSNYRGVLRSLEEITGLTMKYDQEGVKETEQTVASRGSDAKHDSADKTNAIDITSVPDGAEIEVDGVLVGDSPRMHELEPGEYTITLRKSGYKVWERKVMVTEGETLKLHADLESQ